jgi:hypothetical protein
LYKQILDIEDQLLCSNVQTKAEEAFDDLKKSFEEFQGPSSRPQSQTQKKPKPALDDDS